ncbi:hypothetical protein RM555_09300 [Micromonospora sp. DSM 115977]|uniref:Dioxygenase n=1 Tax=Micromonospora reichwaldensis TaxID=3075516 RepID=A0ABU2WTF4_9ACTN|nr:hypothetical protein [Micromonospora sp. DSM 115977]MDT0529186.1 hypothetical protein [Micromonospora sp. DSM 115977]
MQDQLVLRVDSYFEVGAIPGFRHAEQSAFRYGSDQVSGSGVRVRDGDRGGGQRGFDTPSPSPGGYLFPLRRQIHVRERVCVSDSNHVSVADSRFNGGICVGDNQDEAVGGMYAEERRATKQDHTISERVGVKIDPWSGKFQLEHQAFDGTLRLWTLPLRPGHDELPDTLDYPRPAHRQIPRLDEGSGEGFAEQSDGSTLTVRHFEHRLARVAGGQPYHLGQFRGCAVADPRELRRDLVADLTLAGGRRGGSPDRFGRCQRRLAAVPRRGDVRRPLGQPGQQRFQFDIRDYPITVIGIVIGRDEEANFAR